MNRTHALVGALLLAATLGTFGIAAQNVRTNSAAPSAYKIDAVHSTAIFRVHHLKAGRFYGRFNDVTGTFSFAEGSESDLSFDVSIAIDSVDSGNDQLDAHLKSPDFFNTREFPAMSFKSASAKRISDGVYEVKGRLEMHGETRDLTTRVEFTGASDMGRGERCGFETTFTIARSDFGMNYGVGNGMIGDETMVIVSLEGIKQ